MLFCSRAFLCFFLAVFTLYWLLPWQRVRVVLLLVASYAFYACWSQWLALLISVVWREEGTDGAVVYVLRRVGRA